MYQEIEKLANINWRHLQKPHFYIILVFFFLECKFPQIDFLHFLPLIIKKYLCILMSLCILRLVHVGNMIKGMGNEENKQKSEI